MYNRYIPNGTAYTRVLEEDAPSFSPPRREPTRTEAPRETPPHHSQTHEHQAHGQARHVPPSPEPEEKKPSLLSGLLKSFKLDDLDTGDILLLLILVFLVLDGDGDNWELIITLGLVILFSLGDKNKKESQPPD